MRKARPSLNNGIVTYYGEHTMRKARHIPLLIEGTYYEEGSSHTMRKAKRNAWKRFE